jgi:hypothetical protein
MEKGRISNRGKIAASVMNSICSSPKDNRKLTTPRAQTDAMGYSVIGDI